MSSTFFGLPTWFVLILGTILIFLIVVLVIKAMKEGREISFWPPKIGQKPSVETTEKNISDEMPVESPDSIIELISLKSPPIGILEIISGHSQGTCAILTEQSRKITVGRKNADISTGDIVMSRLHFFITVIILDNGKKGKRDYQFSLWDANSSNGTYLNGQRVRNVEKLKNGDLIEVGGTGFIVHLWN